MLRIKSAQYRDDIGYQMDMARAGRDAAEIEARAPIDEDGDLVVWGTTHANDTQVAFEDPVQSVEEAKSIVQVNLKIVFLNMKKCGLKSAGKTKKVVITSNLVLGFRMEPYLNCSMTTRVCFMQRMDKKLRYPSNG